MDEERKINDERPHLPRTRHLGTQRFLRWPVFFAVILVVLLELLLYFVLRSLVLLYERALCLGRGRGAMSSAATFDEWVREARRLDAAEGREAWKRAPASQFYDYELLQQLMRDLRAATDRPRELARLLRTVFSKPNIGGIDNEQLYSQTYFGTKYLVHDFYALLMQAAVIVRDSPEIPLRERLAMFRFFKRSYGRAALVLSGGAGMGYYHLGVLKSLHEARSLPKILSGTSAGAMMAALAGVRTDAELDTLFEPGLALLFTVCDESWGTLLRRLRAEGAMFDARRSADKIRRELLLDCDMTFEEAYRRSGRVLNISVISTSKYAPPALVNYINAPRVVVWSAVLASCAIPGVLKPVQLVEKGEDGSLRPFSGHGARWRDGSIKSDLPLAPLTEQHNANYFVVSQVNPHVVLFVYDAHGTAGQPGVRGWGSRMRGGFLSSALESLLKLEMAKWMNLLAGLDLLPEVMGADLRFTFTQTTRGTVTVHPPVRLRDYVGIFDAPTPDGLADKMRIAERQTWPKLTRICNHFMVERLLRLCEHYLASRLRAEEPAAAVSASEWSEWSDADGGGGGDAAVVAAARGRARRGSVRRYVAEVERIAEEQRSNPLFDPVPAPSEGEDDEEGDDDSGGGGGSTSAVERQRVSVT